MIETHGRPVGSALRGWTLDLERSLLVDLSLPIQIGEHEATVTAFEHWRHEDGPRTLGRRAAFGGRSPLGRRLRRAWDYVTGGRRIDATSFPEGLFLGNEILTLSVHAGCHLDAPFHYGPRCEGRPARRIDEIPLEWCLGPGVLLRAVHRGRGEEVTVADLQAELTRIGHRIRPGEIVLLETGADRHWPRPEYFFGHPGVSREAVEFLLDQGVRVIGVDTPGFDPPPPTMIERFYATGDPAHLWPCHLLGREREYLQIERLANLGSLPRQDGFLVSCLPVRIAGAGAAWIRAVAIVPQPASGATPRTSPPGGQ
jgi:kynurenine formamidase